MATYYINKFNTTGGVYPYTRPEDGAVNFYELIMNPSRKIQLQHNDTIRLYNPCPNSTCEIDDSLYDIEINKSVIIVPDSSSNGIILKLNNNGNGLMFLSGASNSYISGIRFKKDIFYDGSLIYAENVKSLYITNCEFIRTPPEVGFNRYSILFENCEHSKIINSYIEVPNIGGGGTGIRLNDCNMCSIEHNSINFNNYIGYGIYCNSTSDNYGNYIGSNVIYNMVSTGIAIYIIGECNRFDVAYNVVRLQGSDSHGVNLIIPIGYGYGMNINNNVFIFDNDETDTVGIFAPDFGVNGISEYSIVNNIFYNSNSASSLENALAMNVSINKDTSDVNYNLFYNINSSNLFYWNGNPNVLSAQGDRTYVDIDPQLLYFYDDSPSITYEISAIDSYLCSASSQSLGAGQYHEHIGIFNQQDNVDYPYTNFIDTVTHDLGLIKEYNGWSYFTFFNNTFTESIGRINIDYVKYYTSGDNYENQFSWESSAASDFPFTPLNHLYNKNLLYVLENKDSIEPFDGIACPANPGYNVSAYPNYETGLFGNSRANYINTCIVEPCIIQDDINEDYIWVNEINAVYVIQNAINPPCI